MAQRAYRGNALRVKNSGAELLRAPLAPRSQRFSSAFGRCHLSQAAVDYNAGFCRDASFH